MHAFPDPRVAPRAEVAPHGGPGRKLMQQGSPLSVCPIQVQNGIDHFSDISCSWVSTWLGGRYERFEDAPFLLGQITGVAESIHNLHLLYPSPFSSTLVYHFTRCLSMMHCRDRRFMAAHIPVPALESL